MKPDKQDAGFKLFFSTIAFLAIIATIFIGTHVLVHPEDTKYLFLLVGVIALGKFASWARKEMDDDHSNLW